MHRLHTVFSSNPRTNLGPENVEWADRWLSEQILYAARKKGQAASSKPIISWRFTINPPPFAGLLMI